MSVTPTNMLVTTVDNVVCIKISGRANFTGSVDFKTLVEEMRERGAKLFILDVSDCLIMDSTFLGVLAGFAANFSEGENGKSGCIELLNPSARVSDLLDNLGVSQYFKTRTGPNPFVDQLKSVDRPAVAPSKVDVSRTCLEAHQKLMELNPNNVPKFKDVTKFLAEDLKKAQG